MESLSEKFLDQCTKDQLVKMAEYYMVDVGDKRIKETVRANLKVNLVKMNVLGTAETAEGMGDLSPPVIAGPGAAGLSFKQQELLVLHMQLDKEKEVAVQKMWKGIEMEKLLSLEKIRQETEQAKLELQKQKLNLIREGKVAADLLLTDNSFVPGGTLGKSDDLNDLRLCPNLMREIQMLSFQ